MMKIRKTSDSCFIVEHNDKNCQKALEIKRANSRENEMTTYHLPSVMAIYLKPFQNILEKELDRRKWPC